MTPGEITLCAVGVFFLMQQMYMIRLAKRAADKVQVVAEKLDETTTVQTEKLVEIAKVGEATHTLCNSAMGAQKRLLAATARAKYEVTGSEVDRVAAEFAEADLRAHEAKQAIVDSGKTTPK